MGKEKEKKNFEKLKEKYKKILETYRIIKKKRKENRKRKNEMSWPLYLDDYVNAPWTDEESTIAPHVSG